MKYHLFACIGLLGIGACTQQSNQVKEKAPAGANYVLDTSVIAVLNNDSLGRFSIDGKSIELNSIDLYEVDSILKLAVNKYNPAQEHVWDSIIKQNPEMINLPYFNDYKKSFVIDLKRYKRQYIAVVNKKGEKEVSVNCFCESFNQNWKEKYLHVYDGGNCFFNLIVNLKTKSYHDFMVNGSG